MNTMPQTDTATTVSERRTFLLWTVYLVFVVYGSLVPLDFRPMPLTQAWEHFARIRMLALGADSRADWIANGVLYLPLGFLTTQLLLGDTPARRWLAFLLTAVFCTAVAVGVEFTQIFFAPRTVSQNDIAAEVIGSLLGLILATHASHWFASLLEADSSRLRRHLFEAYLVGYIAFCLFPYDVLLSAPELTHKIASDNWGWLLAGNEQGMMRTTVKALLEVCLTLPFGIVLGAWRAPRHTTLLHAVLAGLVLGACIEISQFFTVSGIAQGISLFTRAIGTGAGLALWQRRDTCSPQRLRELLWRYSTPLTGLYLAALLFANGWFAGGWSTPGRALAKIGELHFLPFYYHYYTTEVHALVSAATIALMYLPVGTLIWAAHGGTRLALISAGLVAGVVETSKFFIADQRPDPTNVLLAALSAWCVVHLAQLLGRSSTAVPVPTGGTSIIPAEPPLLRTATAVPADYALLIVSLAFCAYQTATFPTLSLVIGSVLAASAAIVWLRPTWLIAIVLAALPVFDLAPASGRFFFDEYDLLLIVVLSVANARIMRNDARARRNSTSPALMLLLSLLATSFAISALRGALSWPPLDANALSSYYSPLNALRIGKGVLWAMLIFTLLRRQTSNANDIYRPLCSGMIAGLVMTVAVVIWERIAFSGLFDFAADYRVTGPFSAMHTGGAYIECFLAAASPYLFVFVLQSRSRLSQMTGTLLLLATTYALMVTFSRNGYLAFGVALATVLFFALFRRTGLRRNSLLAAALGVAVLTIAWPVFTGQYAQSRLATVDKDFAVRYRHWQDALDLRPAGWATSVFGTGLGRFPESDYLLARDGSRAASYQFRQDNGNTYLRLRSGSSLYFEQLVPVQPRQRYRLTLDMRSEQPNATLTVPICEKWLLSSYNCSWNTFRSAQNQPTSNVDKGNWRHVEKIISTDKLRNGPWYEQRPIKLALYNGARDAVIDVDNISLVRLDDDTAKNLIHNSDFSGGMDHWFFSVDSHLQWHVKSLPVAVLFDQGWFGVLSFGLFALYAVCHAAARAWHGDLQAAATFAALSAFLTVGVFDTLIDAPRFLMLIIILGYLESCSGITGNGLVREKRLPQTSP